MSDKPLSQEEITQALTALEDTAATFTDNEDSNLFGLGLAIRETVLMGVSPDLALPAVGIRTGRSKSKVYKAYAVGMVFGADIDPEFDWQLHVHCATADGVDPANPDTYQIAQNWRNVAEDGKETTYTLKSGKVVTRWRKHTAHTLKAAIRAAAGGSKPKAEVVVRSAICKVVYVDNFDIDPWAKVMLATNTDLGAIHDGETVTVTITRQPQPQAAETESEAA